MPFKPHPTDPDKMVYTSRQYDMPDTPSARAYLAKVLEDDDTQVYGDALTIAYQSGYYDGKKAAQPAQEPVVFCMHWQDRWGCNHYVDPKEPYPENAKPLYTHPPQHEWVGLTDDDIEELFQSAAGADEETHIRFARAIETALRSKNNAA